MNNLFINFIPLAKIGEIRRSKKIYKEHLENGLAILYPHFIHTLISEDIRLTYLRKMFLSKIFLDKKDYLTQEFCNHKDRSLQKIINTLIQSLVEVISNERKTFVQMKVRDNVLQGNSTGDLNQSLYKVIKDIVKEIKHEKKIIKILSLGCGVGDKEEYIDRQLKNIYKDIQFIWLGYDSEPYPNTFFHKEFNSFISAKDFKIKSQQIVKKKKNEKLLILAICSLHHMLISSRELENMFPAADAIILYEEPISKDMSSDFLLYALRLAYDILANFSFDSGWSKEFLINPRAFNAKYLLLEDLQNNYHSVPIKDRSPSSYIFWKLT